MFRKNLGRFWPLWGGLSLAGAMVPLYILLGLLGNRLGGTSTMPEEFAYCLYQAVTVFAPAFIACYAILCAMAVWGYLYNGRSVGLMHTLPVDRTCLFVTNTLSGLVMVLIPFAVVGLLLCLIALFWGFFDLTAVVVTALAVLLLSVLFFGMATLCAMLTGHSFVLPAFYLLLSFLAPLLYTLVFSLAQTFLMGISMEGLGVSAAFSPIIQIYESFRAYSEHLADGGMRYSLSGMGVVALYGLAGVALLALAWFLYRRRQSESAGDVVAFRWLRPVFRYGVALLSGLTLGRLLYELLWALLFQQGGYADLIPMCVCMAATGVLGYYAASMLLEKSLRVFRRSWPGVAAVCTGAVLLCALVSLDPLGSEQWVPEPEEVSQVTLRDWAVNLDLDAADPELVRQVVGIHRAIVEDRDYVRAIRGNTYLPGEPASRYLRFVYRLKDGREVNRYYNLWVTAERAEDPDTYDGRMLALYNDLAVIRSRVSLPEDAEIMYCHFYNYGGNVSVNDCALSDEETRLLCDALLQDAGAGNVPGYELFNERTPRYWNTGIEIQYRTWEDRDGAPAYYGQSIRIDLYPTMAYTLRTLEEIGCLTQGDLAELDAALREDG